MLIKGYFVRESMEVEVGEGGKKLLKKIPHEGNEIIFEYKVYKGNYGEVAEVIDKMRLIRPSSSHIASLIYDACINPEGKCESNILNVIKENWLWEFTGNDYLPEGRGDFQGGVILQDNPLIANRRLVMNKNDLTEKLNSAEEFRINGNPIFISKDRLVRFVPFGFKLGYQTPQELSVNPYVIAKYLGRKNNETEGAEKIAIVSSKYKNNPLLYSLTSVDKETAMMSGLDNVFDHSRLYISGEIWNFASSGYGFGIFKDELSELKK